MKTQGLSSTRSNPPSQHAPSQQVRLAKSDPSSSPNNRSTNSQSKCDSRFSMNADQQAWVIREWQGPTVWSKQYATSHMTNMTKSKGKPKNKVLNGGQKKME